VYGPGAYSDEIAVEKLWGTDQILARGKTSCCDISSLNGTG
jgi:hypothetical protein